MSNKYKRGYRAELRAKYQLEKYGYIVMRSAASKGPFDLIGIRKSDIVGVQVKVTQRLSEKRNLDEMDKLTKIPAPENMRKELWVWVEKQGFLFYTEIKRINESPKKETMGRGEQT